LREFDNDQKIALMSQFIGSVFILICIAASYNYITTNLPKEMVTIIRNIIIGLFSFNILMMGLQLYRYKKSGLYRVEKIIRHCKKKHISFDRIVNGEDGTASIFKGEQKVSELKLN
jgi:isocitrate dehydrogenase kinase/phosphatase